MSRKKNQNLSTKRVYRMFTITLPRHFALLQDYEVDPLCCPKCGAEMKIGAFIEGRQRAVVERILKHCGLWNEESDRVPPQVQGRTQAETVKSR